MLSGLYDTGLDGSVLTMRAFDKMLPGNMGGIICLASLVLFGFTCLISFYTYAERAAEYIFGSGSKLVIKLAMFAIPLVMIVAGYIVYLKKYKISEQFYAQILKDLEK